MTALGVRAEQVALSIKEFNSGVKRILVSAAADEPARIVTKDDIASQDGADAVKLFKIRRGKGINQILLDGFDEFLLAGAAACAGNTRSRTDSELFIGSVQTKRVRARRVIFADDPDVVRLASLCDKAQPAIRRQASGGRAVVKALGVARELGAVRAVELKGCVEPVGEGLSQDRDKAVLRGGELEEVPIVVGDISDRAEAGAVAVAIDRDHGRRRVGRAEHIVESGMVTRKQDAGLERLERTSRRGRCPSRLFAELLSLGVGLAEAQTTRNPRHKILLEHDSLRPKGTHNGLGPCADIPSASRLCTHAGTTDFRPCLGSKRGRVHSVARRCSAIT